MVPSVAHQLSAVLRALQDVVMPALDPENKLATQQAHMCVTTLRLIAEQHDQTYHLALTELRLFTRFLNAVTSGDCSAVEPTLRARLQNAVADRWSQFSAPRRGDIEALTRELRETADALVTAPSVRTNAALHDRVMAAARDLNRDESVLRRAWLAAMGADADANTLPTLAELIAHTEVRVD